MSRYGMLINTKTCIGCFTCLTACQRQNNLLADEYFITFHELEKGVFPHVYVEHVPTQCMHCDDAPCARVCPTGATFINEQGIVCVEQGRCIGCKYCMAACPYQARVQNHETGVVDKCRFCAVASLGGTKTCSCVDACPTHSRIIGDLDDPNSKLSQEIIRTNALPLNGDLTKSKIFYVR